MFLNKLSLIACAIAAMATVSSAHAATTIAQEKQQVFAVAKKYAEATACETSFEADNPENERTTIKDVFLWERDTETGLARYYILWGGDAGCLGGSGTYLYQLSEVGRYSNNRPFIVIDDVLDREKLTGIEAGQINNRFIKSVKLITPKTMEIVAWNYADAKYGGKDGGNNFPANKFKYTVSNDESGYWKVSNQLLLEQNK